MLHDKKILMILKKYWGTVKSMLGNDEKECIRNGNELMADPTEIANCFNEFFSNVGKKLSDKIAQPPNFNLKPLQVTSSTIFLNPATPQNWWSRRYTC